MNTETTALIPVGQGHIQELEQEEGPRRVQNPSGRVFIIGLMTKTMLATGEVAAIVFVSLEYLSDQPNWTVVSVCQLGGGALARLMTQIDLHLFDIGHPRFMDYVHDYCGANATAVYLLLYNLLINLNPSQFAAQAVLTAIRQFWVGNIITGFVVDNIFRRRPHIHSQLDQEGLPSINPMLLSPAYTNTNALWWKYTGLTLLGGGVGLGGLLWDGGKSQYNLLMLAGGGVTVAIGPGYGFAHWFYRNWKKMEAENKIPTLDRFQIRGVLASRLLRGTRIVGRSLTRTATGVFSILKNFVKGRWVYLPLGALFGVSERGQVETVQTMTTLRYRILYVDATSGQVKQLAVKIYFVTSVSLLSLAVTGLILGDRASAPHSDTRQDVNMMLASIGVTTTAVEAANYFFTPGHPDGTSPNFFKRFARRCLNEMYYLLKNPLILYATFQVLLQYTDETFNNETVNDTSGFARLLALAEAWTYAAVFVIECVSAGSLSTRLSIPSSVFLALAAEEIIAGLKGQVTLPAS